MIVPQSIGALYALVVNTYCHDISVVRLPFMGVKKKRYTVCRYNIPVGHTHIPVGHSVTTVGHTVHCYVKVLKDYQYLVVVCERLPLVTSLRTRRER